MSKAKKSKNAVSLQEACNRFEPLLRELVYVAVFVDGEPCFDARLTRVPGIGEEVVREDRTYKVFRVQHEPIDKTGRARGGYHAFVDAELVASDETEPS